MIELREGLVELRQSTKICKNVWSLNPLHEGEKKMDDTTVIRQYFRGEKLLFSQTVQKLAGIQIFP